MDNTFDLETNILIIGGGPSGSTLARQLALSNIKTILVEKNYSYDKPCGGGIKSIVFEEFNIPKKYENKLIKDFTLYSPKNKVNVDLSKTPISIVLRKEFDEANRQLAKQQGAVLIEGRYRSTHFEKDFLIVDIKEKNKNIKIKCKYLVGADGVRSSVRKSIFDSYPQAILTNYSNICSKPINKCEFYFGKNFSKKDYAWVFPHGDKISVGAVLNNTKIAKKEFIDFKNKIIKNDKTKINGFYIPYWQKNDIFYKNRVFLVGDAAGQVLPFTYEGIYYAMKSAKILAQAIIENKPENYEKNWNKIYKRRFEFFRFTQNIFLSNAYLSNKLIKFFQNKKLQEKGLKYWEGTAKPLNLGQAVFKIIKHLIKN